MGNMIRVEVDETALSSFVEEGGKLVFQPEAEGALLKLFELRDKVEAAIEAVKAKIVEAGVSVDPSFKGVVGERIKAIYIPTGKKYKIEPGADTDMLKQRGYVKEVSYLSPVADEIDAADTLPEGIIKIEREKKLTLGLTKE